mgnify:CR=1 FL=1
MLKCRDDKKKATSLLRALKTQKTALNEQAIQQIADGLSRQVEISQATDEKLGTLIELMLKERR